MPGVWFETADAADVSIWSAGIRRETYHGGIEQLYRLHGHQLRRLPLATAAWRGGADGKPIPRDTEAGTMTVSNEEILRAVQEKLNEKNEVITEQQLQIQTLEQDKAELQQRIVDLEQQLITVQEEAAGREELLKQISELAE